MSECHWLPWISCGDVQGIMGIGWPSDSWCNLDNYKARRKKIAYYIIHLISVIVFQKNFKVIWTHFLYQKFFILRIRVKLKLIRLHEIQYLLMHIVFLSNKHVTWLIGIGVFCVSYISSLDWERIPCKHQTPKIWLDRFQPCLLCVSLFSNMHLDYCDTFV